MEGIKSIHKDANWLFQFGNLRQSKNPPFCTLGTEGSSLFIIKFTVKPPAQQVKVYF